MITVAVGEVVCSLCGQEFKLNDPTLERRKERHEDHHDETKAHGSKNQTWGKVDWAIKKLKPLM